MAANAAMFVGWGPLIPGRERQAIEFFGEVTSFYTRLQQEGAIESFEPVILGPHGGDLDGFILIRGTLEQLLQVRMNETAQEFERRSEMLVTNFGIVEAYIGEGLSKVIAGRRAAAGKIA